MIDDDVDTNEVHQRLSFVNALYRWSNNRHDAGVLEAALDAIPPGVDLEPTMAYKAHWTTYRLGILRCLAKARKDMNLAVTIIDVQAVEVCSIVKDGQW
jgi:hypothetical protein